MTGQHNTTTTSPTTGPQTPRETLKDTLISIAIAFVIAFVFRGFVVEAFVIPTGSMAPTLMGAHHRFHGPETGYDWPVEAWPRPNVEVTDPMTASRIIDPAAARRTGDRILVLKYLAGIFDPARFDVAVFKNPTQPTENYIKRLVGLPNEQIAIIDGDIFVRTPQPNEPTINPNNLEDPTPWLRDGWRIARKPPVVQDAVWQPVFDSQYSPVTPSGPGATSYIAPWRGSGPGGINDGWTIADNRVYNYDGVGPASLRFIDPPATGIGADPRRLVDRTAYNELPTTPDDEFPVSDVRIRLGVEPVASPVTVNAVIAVHGHIFTATLTPDGNATLTSSLTFQTRPDGSQNDPNQQTTLATAQLRRGALDVGRITNLEFAYADQQLQLRADGRLILQHDLNWTPAQRIVYATGQHLDAILRSRRLASDPVLAGELLARPDTYKHARPVVSWTFTGGPVNLHRVAVDRDLFYRPAQLGRGQNIMTARGGTPARTVTLGKDQHFVLGDNSARSLDSRFWGAHAPWINDQIDPTVGVVHRKLMIGKAFFVYFPSLLPGGPVPAPDAGKLRMIF